MEKRDAMKTTTPLHFIAQGVIPAFIVIIAILTILDIRVVFEPPLLLFILNTLFISVISLAVASISARNYLARGSLSFLLLGCGVLAFGSGGLVAGWLIGPPGGPNVNVTIYDTGALLGAVFHATGAILASAEVTSDIILVLKPKSKMILAYLGVLVLTALLTIASLRGAIPPYIIQGIGPTLLGQVVLGTAVALFGISSLFFMRLYSKSKEAFQYWYSLALALIAVGLSAVFLQKAVGSPIGWAGRSAQYLGGIYFFIAVLITYMEGRLRISEEKLRSVFASSPDAITVIDLNGNILECSQSSLDIHGCSSKDEVLGENAFEFIAKKDHERAMEGLKKTLEQGSVKDIEHTFLTKDGWEFPAELSASVIKDSYSNPIGFVLIARDITERKRTEKALREQREELQIILDSVPAYIFYKDTEGRHIRVNKALAEATGIPEEEWIGKTIFGLLPNLAERYHRDDMEVIASGQPKRNIVEPIETPEGIRWAQTDKIPLRDEKGNVVGLIGLSVDITDHKRAEEALRESEQRCRQLFKGINDAVMVYSSQGRFLDCNEATLQRLGYSREEFLRLGAADIVHPDFHLVMKDNQKRIWAGETTVVESAHRCKDGRVIPVEVNARRIEYQGEPAILAVVRDITEHKRAEEALRESEERYRSLFEGVPVGLYRTTPEGQIIDVNPALVQMLGYPDRQALLAINITDVYLNPEERRRWQALMEREGVVRDFEAQLRRRDGTIIWVRNSSRAVRDGDGQVLYYEGSLEDITKRKQAEEEREQLLAELEAKNKELESFVYTISHDLKTPLVSLDGFSSALQEEFHHQLGEEGKHYVERIQDNVARMEALIMHLLDLSRIGRVVGPIEEIEVAALLREIQEELAVELEEAGAELGVQEPLPAVRADRSRMHQVFANLIDNAVKFRSEERPLRIEVGCQEERGFYRFHVADNGIGIAPQYHEQIFTPFRQLDPEAQGVGMGLALVKKIVEHHGGRVWAESEEGEGTTLYFTLPESAELNRSAETSASLRAGPQAEGSVEPLNRSPNPKG